MHDGRYSLCSKRFSVVSAVDVSRPTNNPPPASAKKSVYKFTLQADGNSYTAADIGRPPLEFSNQNTVILNGEVEVLNSVVLISQKNATLVFEEVDDDELMRMVQEVEAKRLSQQPRDDFACIDLT